MNLKGAKWSELQGATLRRCFDKRTVVDRCMSGKASNISQLCSRNSNVSSSRSIAPNRDNTARPMFTPSGLPGGSWIGRL
jgi:hypothetical protein